MEQTAEEDGGDAIPWRLLGIVLAVATVAGVAVLTHWVLTLGSCACPQMTPAVEFEVANASGGVVTIVHDGGDTASAGNLFVVVDGDRRPVTEVDPRYNESATIRYGDTIRVRNASPGSEILIGWNRPDGRGGESAVLAKLAVPNATTTATATR